MMPAWFQRYVVARAKRSVPILRHTASPLDSGAFRWIRKFGRGGRPSPWLMTEWQPYADAN